MDTHPIDRLFPLAHVAVTEPPATKSAAIEFLLDLVADNGRVHDRAGALAAIRERERQGSTGVGLGIAIPHAKTDAVTEPSVAFARSEAGVDFGAADDTDAHLLFLLLVPADEREQHLGILSALSRALMHQEVRDALLEAPDAQTIQQTIREAVR